MSNSLLGFKLDTNSNKFNQLNIYYQFPKLDKDSSHVNCYSCDER